MTGRLVAAAFLGLAAALLPGRAFADPTVEEFYRSKTLLLIVGYSPGGLYDITARLLARHLGEHIPGKPTVVVSNSPGAGSITALLHLYNTAPRDGSVIGMVARSYPIDPLFNPAARKYDPLRFNPIGATSPEVLVAVTWHTAPVKTFDELLKTAASFGATGLLDDTGRFAVLAKNLSGAKVKLVLGYPGGNDVTNAMEKGEVDGRFGWSWGSIKSRARAWLDDRKINIILQQGLKKAADLPDTPFILDYAKSDRDRRAFEADLRAAELRLAVHRAARRAGRSARGAAPGVRCDDEGPGLHGRGRETQYRDRSDRRRGNGRADPAHSLVRCRYGRARRRADHAAAIAISSHGSADAGARPLQPRVEHVAQPVAQQVDPEHGEEDAQAREKASHHDVLI